jgi:uncharacterized membrane protein (DUF2068 family)
MEEPHRPIGITILAVLETIGALVLLALGTMVILLGAAVLVAIGLGEASLGIALSEIVVFVGGFILLLGVIELAIAWGLWKGQGWAWTVALIVAVLGIIGGVIALVSGSLYNIVTLAIQVIIVYYLYRPEVKAYFGKK